MQGGGAHAQVFFPRNGPALTLVPSEAVKLSSCIPAIRRDRDVQSCYLNKAVNTRRFSTDIQHTLGSRDFFGKAQQPLFAFCDGNTLKGGLSTQDVPMAQLVLGSPSSVPLFAAGEGTRQSSAARAPPGRLGCSQGGRGLRRALRWQGAEGSWGPGLPGTAHASTAAQSGKTLSAQPQTEKRLKPGQIT